MRGNLPAVYVVFVISVRALIERKDNGMGIHGGDVYRNQVAIDFSVNINPLGVPEAVKAAMYQAADMCDRYPDGEAERLKRAVSNMLGVPKEYLLFGNGASELLMALIHAIKPKKTVIPVPSFYGYEYAAKAAEGKIFFYEMKQEDHFCLTKDFEAALTEDTELLFLANPNNPTGNLLGEEELKTLLQHCKNQAICVVLDECFIEFCGSRFSMLSEIEEFDNLILLRAFTKIFSIPGVRLGYLVCKDKEMLKRVGRQLPEWNLSCFAQEAGCACAKLTDFIAETEAYVRKERQFLEEEFRKKNFQVFSSAANFILLYSEKPLYEQLLKERILIRDCRNFRGLRQGFYRIAVKSRKENEMLLRML